jgi:hypothetical protein
VVDCWSDSSGGARGARREWASGCGGRRGWRLKEAGVFPTAGGRHSGEAERAVVALLELPLFHCWNWLHLPTHL